MYMKLVVMEIQQDVRVIRETLLMEVIMDKKQALEAMERIFNYCEEIDLHLPEDERTGYDMLPDVQLVERYILSKDD